MESSLSFRKNYNVYIKKYVQRLKKRHLWEYLSCIPSWIKNSNNIFDLLFDYTQQKLWFSCHSCLVHDKYHKTLKWSISCKVYELNMKSEVSHQPLQTPNCLTRVLPTLWKAWAFKIWPSPHLAKPALESFQATQCGLGGGSLSLPWSPFHPQVSLLHDTRAVWVSPWPEPKAAPRLHKPPSGAVPAEGWKEHSGAELGCSQASAAGLQVLTCKTRAGVREARRLPPA